MSNLALAWAWQQDLPITPKLILVSIADRANEDGICWPSIDDFRKRTGKTSRTVNKCIAELIDGELIQRRERFSPNGGQLSNLWLLPIYGHTHA